jgi:F0F1-type ATP synthase membrane subunit b/b'
MELPLRLVRVASPAELVEARRAFEEDLRSDYSDQAEALHQTCFDTASLPPAARYGGELLKAQEHARQLLDQAKAQADRIIASARARADEMLAEAARKASPQRRSANA